MHQCIKFILFWNDILHVSDVLSVHRQEFKTVHRATGMCQTDTALCFLASSQQHLLLYVQSWTPDDGRIDRPKHVEQCFSTAGPRPGTGPWHQLYRAARGSSGICHFSFL